MRWILPHWSSLTEENILCWCNCRSSSVCSTAFSDMMKNECDVALQVSRYLRFVNILAGRAWTSPTQAHLVQAGPIHPGVYGPGPLHTHQPRQRGSFWPLLHCATSDPVHPDPGLDNRPTRESANDITSQQLTSVSTISPSATRRKRFR